MLIDPVLAIALSLLPLSPNQGGQLADRRNSPFERGEVVAFEIPERPGARHEFFRLKGSQPQLGVASIHIASELDQMRSEMRLDFFPIKTTVIHIERQSANGPRLIWRERRLRSGRTVQVDWSADGNSLSSVDWSGRDANRRQSRPESGALLPLYLVEQVRGGQFLSGRFDVFSPLSNRVEEWTATVKRFRVPWFGPGFARQLVLRRKNGSLAGEYIFQNEELLLFRLQQGGVVAVRTSRKIYEQAQHDDLERRTKEHLRDQPSPASTRWLVPRRLEPKNKS